MSRITPDYSPSNLTSQGVTLMVSAILEIVLLLFKFSQHDPRFAPVGLPIGSSV